MIMIMKLHKKSARLGSVTTVYGENLLTKIVLYVTEFIKYDVLIH